MTFNGLNGGEAGGDACVPGQVMVRPGDRTSLKAGGDACAPGQRSNLSYTPYQSYHIPTPPQRSSNSLGRRLDEFFSLPAPNGQQ